MKTVRPYIRNKRWQKPKILDIFHHERYHFYGLLFDADSL